jgi:glycosyltransferase involved in cell wall biosynthesis
MAVHPDEHQDLAALKANGWELVDPIAVAGTPDAYRDFVRGSRAEIGIAKSGYVASRCGWFSDRSACYLASGRPVVAQDTGFSSYLPVGEGLFAFDDEDGAVNAIEELGRNYSRHARAARELAIEYFDSDRVLTMLLEQVAP